MTVVQTITLFSVMVALAALPSSSVALVVARSATLGVKNGIAVAVGIVLADLVFVVLAILGLSAVAIFMGSYFTLLKFAGGLYLIWLGITLLKYKGPEFFLEQSPQNTKSLLVSFFAGFVLTLGDIKAIIFYASLFPFFIDQDSAGLTDYAVIVSITVLSVGSVKILFAIFASKIAKHLHERKPSSAPQKFAGTLLVGVGSYVAFKA